MKTKTHLLKEVLEMLNKFTCISDEDSLGAAFFKARLNEDSFYILKEEIEKELSILPCRFCNCTPNWSDEVYLDKWDGWLTHECKAKYYALAGKKEHCIKDWNWNQNNQHHDS